MYSMVLVMALGGGAAAPADHGCWGNGGCWGSGHGCSGWSGCHGGGGGHKLFGGLFGGHGCSGGGHKLFGGGHGCNGGGCWGSSHGCNGGGHRLFGGGHGCNGCNGGGHKLFGGLFGRHGGCHGGNGCWGSSHGCSGSYGCHGGYGGHGGGYGCYGGGHGGYGCNGGGHGCAGGVIYQGMPIAPATGGEMKKEMPAGGEKVPAPAKEAQNTSAPATLIVSLPADAKLTIDGTPTQATSARRVFVTPALERGETFSYVLEGEVVRDGQTVKASKEVTVRAGEQSSVELQFATGRVAQR